MVRELVDLDLGLQSVLFFDDDLVRQQLDDALVYPALLFERHRVGVGEVEVFEVFQLERVRELVVVQQLADGWQQLETRRRLASLGVFSQQLFGLHVEFGDFSRVELLDDLALAVFFVQLRGFSQVFSFRCRRGFGGFEGLFLGTAGESFVVDVFGPAFVAQHLSHLASEDLTRVGEVGLHLADGLELSPGLHFEQVVGEVQRVVSDG